MRLLRLILAIILCQMTHGLSSCAKPEYLIAGLTLPPGSTDITPIDGSASNAMFSGGMAAQAKRSRIVAFNNASGWSAVSSHIDRCLIRRGYQQGLGGDTHQQEITQLMGFDMSGMVRVYHKEDSPYLVLLTDVASSNAALAKAVGTSLPTAQTGTTSGDFLLEIYQMAEPAGS